VPGAGIFLNATLIDSGRRLSLVFFFRRNVMLGTILFLPSTTPAAC
jgi:hypothetical protein